MPLRESDAVAETAGAWGGQKCSVIKHPPPLTPCLGLQKQDRLPQRTLPFCQPRGLLQTAQEFGIGIRQGLQLGGEFLPSSVSPSYCLALASPVFPVWLRCPPRSVFWYCFCSRARVMWVVTSEFDGKWSANSDHNKGEDLNCRWLWQKNRVDGVGLCY